MITDLDVVWIRPHPFVSPIKDKMLVCVSAEQGLYFNINSKGYRPQSVLILLADHPFLDHDSYIECGHAYIECGHAYEFDEYTLGDEGPIGVIIPALVPALLAEIKGCITIPERDKSAIIQALTALP